jgi:hypothetical protein
VSLDGTAPIYASARCHCGEVVVVPEHSSTTEPPAVYDIGAAEWHALPPTPETPVGDVALVREADGSSRQGPTLE